MLFSDASVVREIIILTFIRCSNLSALDFKFKTRSHHDLPLITCHLSLATSFYTSNVSFFPNPIFLLSSYIFIFANILGTHSIQLCKHSWYTQHPKEGLAEAIFLIHCFNTLKCSTFPVKNISKIKHSSPGST